MVVILSNSTCFVTRSTAVERCSGCGVRASTIANEIWPRNSVRFTRTHDKKNVLMSKGWNESLCTSIYKILQGQGIMKSTQIKHQIVLNQTEEAQMTINEAYFDPRKGISQSVCCPYPIFHAQCTDNRSMQLESSRQTIIDASVSLSRVDQTPHVAHKGRYDDSGHAEQAPAKKLSNGHRVLIGSRVGDWSTPKTFKQV
jgi:hypothetical protein